MQPINSRASGDETYKLHWNLVWEPSEDDIPIWEYTPPGVSAPLFSSDMEEVSPILTEEFVAMSGEIPTATEPTPVSSTPTAGRVPV